MRKDAKGKIHFKIVFTGCSMAGKTSILKSLHDQVVGLVKGGLTSIADPSGRTIYFDFTPFSANENVLFDVYTVAGQQRHHDQRKMILRGVDGILFVVDSNPDLKDDNIKAAKELQEIFGNKLGKEIPLVLVLNKRDLSNALSREEMLESLGFPKDVLAINAIAVKGVGVKQAFQAVSREIIMKEVYDKA